jgi:hypothetical protein
MRAGVTTGARLEASAEAAAQCTAGPTPIVQRTLAPISFTVGPIPVVLVPRLSIYLAADGRVSASVSTSIDASVTATAGVHYEDGDAEPVGGVDPTFNYTPPDPTASAQLGATITPTLDVLIYGVGGPSAFVSAGLSVQANPEDDPWWTLTAPVKAGAKLTAPVLRLSTDDLVVYDDSFLLASADESSPPAGSRRARIDWNTDGTDVDLHIWDQDGNHAWYGDQLGIPDAELSSDITTGFGPEIFTDVNTPSTRKFTYGLCYYADNGMGPTTVTVKLTDPSGGVRTMTQSLSSTGDHVLLGTSPAGGGYSPPDDWCDR